MKRQIRSVLTLGSFPVTVTHGRHDEPVAAPSEPSREEQLLAEIRDLLKARA